MIKIIFLVGLIYGSYVIDNICNAYIKIKSLKYLVKTALGILLFGIFTKAYGILTGIDIETIRNRTMIVSILYIIIIFRREFK